MGIIERLQCFRGGLTGLGRKTLVIIGN